MMRELAALTEPALSTSFGQALANLTSGVTVIMAYGAAGPLGLAASRSVPVSHFPRYS